MPGMLPFGMSDMQKVMSRFSGDAPAHLRCGYARAQAQGSEGKAKD